MDNQTLKLTEALAAIPGANMYEDFETGKPLIDLSSVDLDVHISEVLTALRDHAVTSRPTVIMIAENTVYSFQLFGLIRDYAPNLEARYNVVQPVADVDELTKDKEVTYTIAVKKAYNRPLTLKERFIDFMQSRKRK